MLNCKITFGDKELSLDEFKEFVLQNGLRALGKPSSQLALGLIARYDYRTAPESLSEMWTKLELEKRGLEVPQFPDSKTVDSVLNPSGQLSDYATQEQIRYNTYSGIVLTGISANFGKVLSYLFETTPISEITSPEGTKIQVNSAEFKELAKEYKTSTPEGIIAKNPSYKVSSREAVELNPEYYYTVDGNLINGFSRTTRDKFKKNVFEVVDTIINLAIDNVKMQKLHILGITNNNANMFLAMLGMGVPMNTVSRIFKTPAVSEISEGGRWTVGKLDALINKTLSEANAEGLAELLSKYTSDPAGVLHAVNNGNYKGLQKISIDSKLLDKIYVGKASPEEKALSDILVLSILRRILPVGEELFSHAQIYSTLRSLPNKKWKLDSIVSKIEKNSTFSDEVATTASLKRVLKDVAATTFKENSDTYKKLAETDPEAAEAFLAEEVQRFMNNKDLISTPTNWIRAGYVNRILRKATGRNIKTVDSVFQNVSPIRLPHVMASYRTMLLYKGILEKAFYIYNPAVRKFVDHLMAKTNMFTPFDALEKADTVARELLKFLTSNLKFDLDGEPLDISAPSDMTYYTSDTTLYGKDAWKQTFLEKLVKIANTEEENAFLNSIELRRDKSGILSAQMVADKVGDEELLEELKTEFERLTINSKELLPGYSGVSFARDLFKYSLMSNSMFFEKTGFSLIFPASWAVAFSEAMTARLNAVIPKNSVSTDINLAILQDKFAVQLLMNNPDLISRAERKPVVTRTVKMSWGNANVYKGVDNVNGQNVYFDLKIPTPYSEHSPRFIKLYNKEVYILKPTLGSNATYYIQLTENRTRAGYDFSLDSLDDSLDLEKLTSLDIPIVGASSLRNGVLTLPYNRFELEAGQKIAIYNRENLAEPKLIISKIENVTTQESEQRLRLSKVEEIPLTKEDKSLQIRKDYAQFISQRTGATLITPTIENYRANALKSNSVVLSNKEGAGYTNLPMLAAINPDSTVEEKEAMLKDLEQLLHSISAPHTNFFIDRDILEPLNSDPKLRRKAADLLHTFTSYTDAMVRTKNESGNIKFDEALKRVEMSVYNLSSQYEITYSETDEHFEITTGGVLNTVTAGDILYAGGETYYYTLDNRDGKITALQFTTPVFLQLPEEHDLTKFLETYTKVMNC